VSASDLRNRLQSLAEARFMRAFGVADLDVVRAAEPDALRGVPGEWPRAVVFGLPLPDAVLESIEDRPTPLYFHAYRQANYQLDSTALEAAATLQAAGHRAIAIAASQIVQHEPMRGHVSHRLLGWAAGLGWWGRNNLLVNPSFGSRVRYVSVLTDAPLEADRPLQRDCGTCVACVRVCPAEAIHGRREEFALDRCYAKLSEFTRIPFVGQHICGVCVKACHPSHWTK
jgi:epoxyqueuosine reductase